MIAVLIGAAIGLASPAFAWAGATFYYWRKRRAHIAASLRAFDAEFGSAQ